jgi:hypothetical protein
MRSFHDSLSCSLASLRSYTSALSTAHHGFQQLHHLCQGSHRVPSAWRGEYRSCSTLRHSVANNCFSHSI